MDIDTLILGHPSTSVPGFFPWGPELEYRRVLKLSNGDVVVPIIFLQSFPGKKRILEF